MAKSKPKTQSPKHLIAATKRWFNTVTSEFVIEIHDLKLLEMMGDVLDLYDRLRKELADAGGTTFEDPKGVIRAMPQVDKLNQCRITFARLRRELALPIAEIDESRIPRLGGART